MIQCIPTYRPTLEANKSPFSHNNIHYNTHSQSEIYFISLINTKQGCDIWTRLFLSIREEKRRGERC